MPDDQPTQADKPKHSPWRAGTGKACDYGKYEILAGSNCRVARALRRRYTGDSQGPTDEEAIVYRDLIIQAVNQHAALVALRDVAEGLFTGNGECAHTMVAGTLYKFIAATHAAEKANG